MNLAQSIATIPLIDHHCHGLMRNDLTRSEFELLATESDWPEPHAMSIFDSPFGVTVRAECAPLLGLPRHCTAEEYWSARVELGAAKVAERLLRATGIESYVIDTGFRSTTILSPEEMSAVADARSSEIVRLESVAESVAPTSSPSSFAEDFLTELTERARKAVGFKSIMAYRHGLDFDPRIPSPAEVKHAAAEWLNSMDPSKPRLDHPVLLRFVLWTAVGFKMPIQFHIGYGDSDIVLHRCDPTQMTGFIKATVDSGCQIMLLHCYPFIREAGFLAQVYPHVWLDTGAAVNYTGPSSETIIRHSLELAPFSKVLFSSDAFGLPELYYCGALLWRRGIDRVFSEWIHDDRMGTGDAEKYVGWMASDNALRAYGNNIA